MSDTSFQSRQSFPESLVFAFERRTLRFTGGLGVVYTLVYGLGQTGSADWPNAIAFHVLLPAMVARYEDLLPLPLPGLLHTTTLHCHC